MSHNKIIVKEAKKVFPEPKPYLSIDIETTALIPGDGVILEIGAVYDDLKSPLEDLMTFHYVCKFDDTEVIKGNIYALQMNVELLKEIAGITKSTIATDYPENVAIQWHKFLANLPEGKAGKKIVVAGKNAAGFDIPWLKHHKFATSCFDFRVLDPGSLYFQEMGKVAGLPSLKKHIGLEDEVTHRALDDAFDVVKLIRYKLGIKGKK